MMLYKIAHWLPIHSVVENTLAANAAPEFSRDYSNNGGTLEHLRGIFRLRSIPGMLGLERSKIIA